VSLQLSRPKLRPSGSETYFQTKEGGNKNLGDPRAVATRTLSNKLRKPPAHKKARGRINSGRSSKSGERGKQPRSNSRRASRPLKRREGNRERELEWTSRLRKAGHVSKTRLGGTRRGRGKGDYREKALGKGGCTQRAKRRREGGGPCYFQFDQREKESLWGKSRSVCHPTFEEMTLMQVRERRRRCSVVRKGRSLGTKVPSVHRLHFIED